MRIEDRIQNIKALLKYCPHSTRDVTIVEDNVGLFFADLFNNDKRFKHTPYSRVYPRIYLSETLNTDYKTHSTSIGIEYTYDNDRDGEYTENYIFYDEDLKDTCFYRTLPLKYSDIPDNIWEIIQNILYDKAMKSINEELQSAKDSVKYWEDKKYSFESTLSLKNDFIKV